MQNNDCNKFIAYLKSSLVENMPDKKNWFYINSDSINAFCDEDGDSAKCDFPWLGAHMNNLPKK